MTRYHPKYLKKIGAPDNDYHIWTPYLAARGDMLPFEPSAMAQPTTNTIYRLELNTLQAAIALRNLSLSEAARQIGMDKGRLSRLLSGGIGKLRSPNLEKIELWLKRCGN